MHNGKLPDFRPNDALSPEMLAAVTCAKCGGAEFDRIDRCWVSYERLKPDGGLVIRPALAFRCSACSEVLHPMDRIRELRASTK